MALYRDYSSSSNRVTYAITHWMTYRGEGNSVRASGNCSSITDLGQGYHRVNFSQSMPDTNYCIFGNTVKGDSNDDGNANIQAGGCDSNIQISTSYCNARTKVCTNNDSQDTEYAHLAFTR